MGFDVPKARFSVPLHVARHTPATGSHTRQVPADRGSNSARLAQNKCAPHFGVRTKRNAAHDAHEAQTRSARPSQPLIAQDAKRRPPAQFGTRERLLLVLPRTDRAGAQRRTSPGAVGHEAPTFGPRRRGAHHGDDAVARRRRTLALARCRQAFRSTCRAFHRACPSPVRRAAREATPRRSRCRSAGTTARLGSAVAGSRTCRRTGPVVLLERHATGSELGDLARGVVDLSECLARPRGAGVWRGYMKQAVPPPNS